MGSNKSFGIVFFVVFALISIYPIINGGELTSNKGVNFEDETKKRFFLFVFFSTMIR